MQVAQRLAGYSLGGADLLRRAMGKKKPEEMAKQKSTFVEGARSQGVSDADSERIFGLLEYFAGYGFNKSHSAAYALITYQTAWLKAHYPAELLCAVLTSDKETNDKVVRTIADAKVFGIPVLPPDVNESNRDFRVVYANPKGDLKVAKAAKVKDTYGPQIRFGLGAVRGIGDAAIEAILEARESGGPFRDMFDFASRVDAKRVNKAVFEALVQSGAFETCHASMGIDRARAFASIDVALERSRAASRDREAGQTSLFGLFGAAAGSDAAAQSAASSAAGDFVGCEPWDTRELLVRERRALGFYVSGHPIDRYITGDAALARLEASWVADCAQMDDWAAVRLVGTVEGWRERIFKGSNDKKAFFELEDTSGRIQVSLRSREIAAFERVLQSGDPVIVSGKLQFPRTENEEEESDVPRDPTLLLNDAQLLADSVKSAARTVLVRLDSRRLTPKALDDMASLFQSSRGPCPVHVHLKTPAGDAQLVLGPDWRVDAGDAVLSGLERVFGGSVAELR
jgi:DNA polymerase-3 subunit alpha